MRLVPPLPLLVTGREPSRDPALERLLARRPGLECVHVRGPRDVPSASSAVTRSLLGGREVRLRHDAPCGSASRAVELGRDGAALTVGTLIDRADEWLDNIAAAFHELLSLPGASALDDAWTGRPALVVGAGPSLDAIDPVALGELAARCVVIAAGSALSPLGRRGLAADVAVMIEGADRSAQLEPPARTEATTLAHAQHGHPAHLSRPWSARLRLDMAENAWFARLAGCATACPSAGNVGAAALALAQRAGCCPIVLAGLDFALSTDGRHHAAGSASGPFGAAGVRPGSTAAAGGGRVATNALLDAYRAGVERLVAAGRTEVIDLADGRKARIGGTRALAAHEALRALPGSGPRRAGSILAGRRDRPDPRRLRGRARALLDDVERFEAQALALAASGADPAGLRAAVASTLLRRPGSLEAALFHGAILDPAREPAASLAERLARSREYRALLEERIAQAASMAGAI